MCCSMSMKIEGVSCRLYFISMFLFFWQRRRPKLFMLVAQIVGSDQNREASLVSLSSAKVLRWTPAAETVTAGDRAPVRGGSAPNKAFEALELLNRQANGIDTCGYFYFNSKKHVSIPQLNRIMNHRILMKYSRTLHLPWSRLLYCAHNTKDSVIGCCTGDLNSCSIFTACVEYSSHSAVCSQAGFLTGCCKNASNSYCATYLWNNPERSPLSHERLSGYQY